ncbi:flotillin family protein [Motilimonas eburnea]|uniref:flotillin family protein n=1 Tax=Motilimonas eburnea TaxID=1737488 RepID=UPI001E60EEBF|nr:hypothetical protein [Motilimonas eburnea]MCE2571303.1 hypothetical protein [Motilimonas eburnea]
MLDITTILIIVGIGFGILLGFALLVKAFYIKVPQGTALIVNTTQTTPKVRFTGALVIPVIHKMEKMRISLITLEIDRRGKDGLICLDNMRADITVAFYLRVNETAEDVLKVAKSIGADRASDKDAVNELFNAKFSEALKTVGKKMEFLQLFEERAFFRDEIVKTIGNDLNGYALEDVAIDYLEQTPKSALDPNNIMDSEGIRKITEVTSKENVKTNEYIRDEERAIKKKNVETIEHLLVLDRQEKEARAKQEREVANIKAREKSEQLKVEEEERLKAESARIQTEQNIAIQEENKLREIEVSQQNRERAIGVEQERVQRAKDLEVVSREREVALQTIEKERALEVEKKEIANVVRERIAVEKTVAEEEERIKEVREVSEADRNRQVVILQAEAQAQEELVKQVKQAEADEIKARHEAQKIITMSQADLEAAAKNADAMKKMAEGIEAENSAPGLAEARVKEALADALEKEGLAKAKVEQETLVARAQGDEQVGLAKARVLEANASAKEKDGLAEAKVLAEKLTAQAQGDKDIGLTEAMVLAEKLSAQAKGDKDIGLAKALASRELGTAEADVLALKLSAQAKGDKEQGMAEAEVLSAKFHAEAQGLVEKFSAMATMSKEAREHEEFRMQLEKDFEQAMQAISVNKDVAVQQAQVLSSALEKANIDIVGGQGDYFNSLSKALTVGKSINGLVGKTPSVAALLNKFIGGEESKLSPEQTAKQNSSDVLGGLLNEKANANQATSESKDA